MTKNKLAKLAAQSSSTDATTNATALPAQQNGQTTVSTVTPPYQNNTSQPPSTTFNVAQSGFGYDGLHDQMSVGPTEGG